MKRAILSKDHKRFVIEDVAEPMIQYDDDVKIKVLYSAFCADDQYAFGMKNRNVHIGHEFSGVIWNLGKAAERFGFEKGDLVTGYTWRFCGRCPYCKAGKENLCINISSVSTLNEYIVLKDRQISKVPSGITPKGACLTELVASCMHGLDRTHFLSGQNVLILGAGGAGQIFVQLCRMQGAAKIVVSDPSVYKRQLALQNGADDALDSSHDELIQHCAEITDFNGFHLIIDACHKADAVQEAIAVLDKGGTLLIFSRYDPTDYFNLNMAMLYQKECTILTSYMAPYMLTRAVELLPRLNIEDVIGKVFTFDNIQQAYDTFCDGRFPRIAVQISS